MDKKHFFICILGAGLAFLAGLVSICICPCFCCACYKQLNPTAPCKICGQTISTKTKEKKEVHYNKCQEDNKDIMDKLKKDEKVRCDLNHAMYAWNNELLKKFTCDEKDCDHFYWGTTGGKNKRKVKRKKSQDNKCENNM